MNLRGMLLAAIVGVGTLQAADEAAGPRQKRDIIDYQKVVVDGSIDCFLAKTKKNFDCDVSIQGLTILLAGFSKNKRHKPYFDKLKSALALLKASLSRHWPLVNREKAIDDFAAAVAKIREKNLPVIVEEDESSVE